MDRMKKYILPILCAAIALVLGLFAAACEKKVTLTFEAGDGTPVGSITAEAGSLQELPLSLRKGYVLSGWSTEEGGEPVSGQILVPDSDTTYYAVWTEGYEVTFDADGGVFAEGAPDPLVLAAGSDLGEAVNGISPTKSGLLFGAWFLGDNEIGRGVKMPAENVTLTAKYKVEYAVETYLANLAGNSYVRSREIGYGSDYVGASVSPAAPMVTGFARTNAPAGEFPITTIVLGEDASRNVLKFYYDRVSCQVLFDGGAPDAAGSIPPAEALYGSTVTVPQNAFSYAGYRFAGWSLYSGGDADFQPGEPFSVTEDTVLFAVWDRGYTDRYGGHDLVFFPRGEEKKAILRRGDYEFEGTRTGDSFSFETPSGTLLEGKILGSTFCYERDDLTGVYTFMEFAADETFEPRYEAQRTIEIDNYLCATYKNGRHSCRGDVVYSDETGDYVFTSTDETFRFLPIRSDAYEYEATFLVGGDEIDSYIDYTIVDTSTGMGYLGMNNMLILDGYTSVVLGDMSTGLSYDGRYYVEDTVRMGSALCYKIVCFIRDPEGTLTGTEGAVVTNYVFTVPLESEVYPAGYVEADSYRGEYSDSEGNTLRLDGFGMFADSALYRENGVERTGTYTISSDLMSGDVVTITTAGGTLSFRLSKEQLTFSPPKQLGTGEYTEFRRMNKDSLQPPFLILYDGAEKNKKRTEVWVPTEDGSDIHKVAEGVSVAEPIGNSSDFILYTFERSSVVAGFESEIPEKIVFYSSYVSSTTENRAYHIYVVLEERVGGEDVSYRTEYLVQGGGTILVSSAVTATGLGALYTDANGNVREGQFTLGSNEHFEGTVGTFLYATEQGEVFSDYYDISRRDDGANLATPRAELERMVYVVQPTGIADGGVGTEMIFLDGVSRMKYTEDQGEHFLEGTYETDGKTRFGETIYSFKVGGIENFRFVLYTLPQEEYAGVPLAVKYDGQLETELGSSEFAFEGDLQTSLVLDGYHTASFKDGDGREITGDYYRDILVQTVTFTADGQEHIFELNTEKKTFREVDWATSRRWLLLDSNFEPIGGYYVVFEDSDEKTVRIETSLGSSFSQGRYVPLGSFNETWGHEEYLLRNVTFGRDYPEDIYRVTFAISSEGTPGCIVYDPETSGVFTDGEWNVLVLDGYGRGAYYASAYTGSGSYNVIDFSANFLSFTIDDPYSTASGRSFYFRTEGTQFFETDYAAAAGVYFSENMESLSFREDGEAYFGALTGPYYIRDGKVYVYLSDVATELDAPHGDTYSYNGKTYRRWDGQTFRLSGKVLMRDKNGDPVAEYPDLNATLSFAPNGTTNKNLAAEFIFDGYNGDDGKPTVYADYTLSLYAGGDSLAGIPGEFAPFVGYGRHSYPITFSYRNGVYTFEVQAGYNSVEYLDHNARYYDHEAGKDANGHDITITRGARLYKNSFGFGAIEHESVTISGDILYLFREGDETYGKPLHFENVPEESVETVGYVPGYGDRLELVFRAEDGKDYALDYYEYYQGGTYFWCYGFFSYEEVETDEYLVRAKTLRYTKMSIAPGYSDAQDGSGKGLEKLAAVTLFDRATQKPIVAYDTGITPNGYGHSVWLVDRADVLEYGSRDTCAWGTGYLVTFGFAEDGSLSSAEVETYRFVQVVNYMKELVNLFFDEDGNTVLASVLVYNGEFGRYDFVSNPHDLVRNGDGTFTFYATWDKQEYRYTVTVEEADDVTFDDDDGEHTMKGYTVTVATEAAN